MFLTGKKADTSKGDRQVILLMAPNIKLRTFTGQIVRLTVSRRTKLTFKNVNTCHIEKITFGKSNKLVSSISFIILGTI